MIRYYIKYAFRNFSSKLSVSLGSLLTIVLGTVCISLLFTYVYNELTMDKFHSRSGDIYITVNRSNEGGEWRPLEADAFFKFDYRNYPELEGLTSIKKYGGGDLRIRYNNLTYFPEGIVTDSAFFKIFDFSLIRGHQERLLKDPDGILITEKFARQLFGENDPIGKSVKVILREEIEYTVKGILENPPSNSSINFDFILPDHSDPNVFSRMGVNFILAEENFNPIAFTEKIKHIGDSHPQFKNSETGIFPFDDFYFLKEILQKKQAGIDKTGDMQNIYILAVMMGIVLIISILNFSNLQVIGTNSFIKQSTITTIYGAEERHLILQKVVEVMLLSIIALVIATGIYHLILPGFNRLVEVDLAPSLSQNFLINLGVILIISLLALIYPVIIFFRLSLSHSLKYQALGEGLILGKRAVVIVQYTLAFVLLMAATVVTRQLHLMLDKDLGFNSSNVIRTKLIYELPMAKNREDAEKKRYELQQNLQYIRNQLANRTEILNFAQGRSVLDEYQMDWKPESADQQFASVNLQLVTPGYEKVHDFQLTEGRFFERHRDFSRSSKVVINEAARRLWQIDDINKADLSSSSWGGGFEIIGVVKDFNYQHLSLKPEPIVMVYFEDASSDFLIRYQEGKLEDLLSYLKQLYYKLNPDQAFKYSLLEDEIQALYKKEKQQSTIYIIFTVVALFVSATGLFAVALYDTQKRVKEIGIRKVNGATIKEIIVLLNGDFLRWVLLSFVIACPVTYYLMDKWLENFAYKTTLEWWMFALAGVITICVALVTVSGLSYRAAITNPVHVLKDE
jgi:putative ABC transport system permease protein